MSIRYFVSCPLTLGMFACDQKFFDAETRQEIPDNDKERITAVAPPLEMVDPAELGRRILARLAPSHYNDHRMMTLHDWRRLEKAITEIADTVGERVRV